MEGRMNIRQLQIFKTVCEEGSITKAAQKLYISQPAVSTTIIELEEYLGFDLFDRVSRNIVLNEKGQVFLNKAVILLDHYNDLHDSFVSIDEKAWIKIGSSITLSIDKLPEMIKTFKNTYPDTPIEVVVKNAEDIEDMLKNHEIDLGLIEGVIKNKELVTIPLSSYEIVMVSSNNHDLAHKTNVSLDELLEYDFLLREKGSAIRDVFDSSLLLNNKSVTPLWTSINSQSLLNATLHNIGITILPEILVSDYLNKKDLHKINCDEMALSNTNQIVYNENKRQSKTVQDLIAIIKETYMEGQS